MGLLDRIRLRNTSGDEITRPSREELRINYGFNDETEESKDLEDAIPFMITRNIKNYRYAYKYNDTINTTIKNLIIIANRKWTIECDDKEDYKEAYKHILQKIKDWKLEYFLDNIIKYPLVDGSMFINRYIDNGSYKFRILGNDDDRYKWIIVRDGKTDEIIGFKQKARIKKIHGSWKGLKYDTLVNADYEDVEYNFDPEEIIYIPYNEEDGSGTSAVESCLDLAYIENRLLDYMIRAGRTAGGFLGVEFGNSDLDAGSLDSEDIEDVTKAFELDVNKTVVGYPYGIEPHEIGKTNLPNFDIYIRLIQSKIRNNLLTPDSKFSGANSNRSTAEEQLNSNTGLIVFIRSIQEFVLPYVNNDMIDKELELNYPNAVGKIRFKYIVDTDNEKELSEIGASLLSMFPNLPSELVLKTYYKRIWDNVEIYKDIFGDKWQDKIDSDLGKFDLEEQGNYEEGLALMGQNAYNRSQHQKSQMLKNSDKNGESDSQINETNLKTSTKG